jgi:hypothetical protein
LLQMVKLMVHSDHILIGVPLLTYCT